MAAAPSSSSDFDDARGFTTAANNHTTMFPLTSDGLSWRHKSKQSDLELARTRSAPILMPPSISPDDLDLEETLVGSDSITLQSSGDTSVHSENIRSETIRSRRTGCRSTSTVQAPHVSGRE